MTPARAGRATLSGYCSGCGTRFTLVCQGTEITGDGASGFSLPCPLCRWQIDLTLEGFERVADLPGLIASPGNGS